MFSELGYHGGSTRDVAGRAGLAQGLVTYYFPSKEDLWKAAVDQVFATIRDLDIADAPRALTDDPREFARTLIAEYVRHAAAHPELFRFLVAEGKSDGERMSWLVDTHLRGFYEVFRALGVSFSVDETRFPHALYAMIGASSLIFAVAPEVGKLTGLDPAAAAAVDRHAQFVSDLFVPRISG